MRPCLWLTAKPHIFNLPNFPFNLCGGISFVAVVIVVVAAVLHFTLLIGGLLYTD